MGGFSFGNIGGNANMNAGGDIVGGDKNTTITTTSNQVVQKGFKDDNDKKEFLNQIKTFQGMMRDIKKEIENNKDIDEDEKDDLVMEIMSQIKALKTVNQDANDISPGTEIEEEKSSIFEKKLNQTSQFMDHIEQFANKTKSISEKIIPTVKQMLPILASARHLFGIP